MIIKGFLLLGLLTNCSIKGVDSSCRNEKDSLLLVKTSEYYLESPNSSFQSFQYFEENGICYLSVLDAIHKSIKVFDLTKQILVKEVEIPELGSSSVLTHIQNSLDWIKIVNFFKGPIIITIDLDGKIVDEFPLEFVEDQKLKVFPFSNNLHRVQLLNGDLYIPLRVYDYEIGIKSCDFTKYPTLRKIDNSQAIEDMFFLPEIYSEHFWGSVNFKYRSTVLFSSNAADSCLLAFAADPMVYLLSGEEVVKQGVVKSNHIKSVNPYCQDMRLFKKRYNRIVKAKERKITGTEMRDWALTNSDYGPILQIPGQDIYMRMTFIRPTQKEFKNGISSPKYGFVLFDNELCKVGETVLPKDCRGDLCFVNEDGLHVVDMSKPQVSFSVFNIELKK